MVKVAIAGGSGGLGRAVAEAIVATGKHDVFVLSRSPKVDAFANEPKVKVLTIDYASPESISKALKDNNVDTVISTMGILGEDHSKNQLNLIEGAVQSGTVKRFAPSEFGIDYIEAKKKGFGLPSAELVGYKCSAVEALQKAGLSYTRFTCGYFLDYFGVPHYKTYMQPIAIVLDVENGAAAIPGDGNVPVVFTLTSDVGKFIAASLNEDWPEHSVIVGTKLTLNEFLKLAEEATGRKFTVAYDSVEKLKGYQVTELPANKPRYQFFPKQMMDGLLAVMGLGMAEGWFDLKGETLNDKFPDVKPTGAKQFLDQVWKSKL